MKKQENEKAKIERKRNAAREPEDGKTAAEIGRPRRALGQAKNL